MSEFPRKWGWIQISWTWWTFPKISWLKIRPEARFYRWKSTDNNNINIFLSLKNPCTFKLSKEKIWKRIFNTDIELSQNRTEKQVMPSKTKVNWLTIYDIIYSLLVLIEKLAFLNKQLQEFIISLKSVSKHHRNLQILVSEMPKKKEWVKHDNHGRCFQV